MIFVQTEDQPIEVVMTTADGDHTDRIEPGAMRAIDLPAHGVVLAFSIRMVDPTPVEEGLLDQS